MSRVASTQSRVVAYLPSLRTILQRLRATSSTPSSLTSTLLTSTATPSLSSITTTTTTTFSAPDVLFNPSLVAAGLHPQLPLPGEMGVLPTPPSPSHTDPEPLETLDTLPLMAAISEKPDQGPVECLVQECPKVLHSGFLQLFPGVSVQSDQLTVITLSERTVNDMTGWSPEVEEEREQLLEHFVESAKEICSRVNAAGFWADFIDPSSGRAFYSPYSNATLFETDDRFRHFGFDIMDLGCCKCIRHPLWGSHTFVGTLFTDAPSDSHAIQSIMQL